VRRPTGGNRHGLPVKDAASILSMFYPDRFRCVVSLNEKNRAIGKCGRNVRHSSILHGLLLPDTRDKADESVKCVQQHNLNLSFSFSFTTRTDLLSSEILDLDELKNLFKLMNHL
jgi:hypothetical protein